RVLSRAVQPANWSWRTPPPAPIDEPRGPSLTLKLNLMCAIVAGLCGRVKPLLQDLVQKHGRRGAHVERLDAPPDRQRDDGVARRRDARPQPLALRAEHEHDA